MPRSPTKACRAAAALPEGPTHTPSSRIPAVPRAESKPPRSRTPNLSFCIKSLLWSTFPGTALPSGGKRNRSLLVSCMLRPQAVRAPGLGALLPEKVFTREEQRKVLQKRTRNIAALGTAPVLAGKLRHALEGMGVPLEDNQRFRVSPTSFYLQSQRSQKAGSPPHTQQPLCSWQDWGHLSVRWPLGNYSHWGRGVSGCGRVSKPPLWPRAGQ